MMVVTVADNSLLLREVELRPFHYWDQTCFSMH